MLSAKFGYVSKRVKKTDILITTSFDGAGGTGAWTAGGSSGNVRSSSGFFTVEWGDGSSNNTYATNAIWSHNYSSTNQTYTIKIYASNSTGTVKVGAITYAVFTGTRFRTIDISNQTEAGTIGCSSTSVTSLDLGGCVGATTLAIIGPNLTSVNLSEISSNVSSLFVTGTTALNSTDLSKLQNLGVLTLSTCDVSGLDLSNRRNRVCTIAAAGSSIKIKDLNLSNSRFTLNCSSAAISSMNLSNADISSISANSATTTGIDLSNARASSSISMVGMSSLKNINVSGAVLSSSLDLSSCTSLNNINIDNANINYLNLSSCNSISGLSPTGSRLTNLTIISSTLKNLDLTPAAFISDFYCNSCSALSGLNITNVSGLSTVDISSTAITGLNVSNSNISSLNCSSNNKFKYVDVSNTPMNSLNLSSTAITGFNIINTNALSLNLSNTSLSSVNLSGSNVTSLNVNNCSSLSSLVPNANLASINLDNTSSLTSLDLSNSNLSSIGFNSNSTLADLNLSNTPVNSVLFNSYTGLTGINLTNCNNINNLDISNTALISVSGLPENILTLIVSYLSSLTSLDVSSIDNLQTLEMYDNTNLTSFLVGGNNTSLNYMYCPNNSALTSVNLDPIVNTLNRFSFDYCYLDNISASGWTGASGKGAAYLNGNNLDASALQNFLDNLGIADGSSNYIDISSNPGSCTVDTTNATNNGWTVYTGC